MPRAKGAKKKEVTKQASKGMSSAQKERDAFIAKLKKDGMMGDIGKKINFLSTGSWVLNRLIGDGSMENNPGGVPRGYITEIYGDESTGKTTIALHLVKMALDAGETVVYADFEQTLRVQANYIKNLGIDIDNPNFVPIIPSNLQDGVSVIGKSIVTLKPALVVIDSVAAMMPKDTVEGDAEEGQAIGVHARLVGQFINWVSKKLQKYDTALVLINQMRANIKTSKYDPGPMKITTGGNALPFFAAVRVKLRQTSNKEKIKDVSTITGVSEDKLISQEVKVIVEKNKVDIPFKSGPLYIVFGKGIDNVMSLITLGVNKRVIKKAGAMLTWNDPDDKLSFSIQGKNNLRKHLLESPETLNALQPYLIPTRDERELENMQNELESKGIENLTQDEKEQLKDLRKARGESIEDISQEEELTEDQEADLDDLNNMVKL